MLSLIMVSKSFQWLECSLLWKVYAMKLMKEFNANNVDLLQIMPHHWKHITKYH